MLEVANSVMEEERPFTDENLMYFIATAIAYADQELSPRNRFIFYRMLLTILDQKQAVPQEMMAKAMGMHPVTYRVCVNRLKVKLTNDVEAIGKGYDPPLDPRHLLVRNRLFRGFDHLYEALMPFYEASIQALSTALEINMLRESCSHNGIAMHEELEYNCPVVVDVREFYDRLKS